MVILSCRSFGESFELGLNQLQDEKRERIILRIYLADACGRFLPRLSLSVYWMMTGFYYSTVECAVLHR